MTASKSQRCWSHLIILKIFILGINHRDGGPAPLCEGERWIPPVGAISWFVKVSALLGKGNPDREWASILHPGVMLTNWSSQFGKSQTYIWMPPLLLAVLRISLSLSATLWVDIHQKAGNKVRSTGLKSGCLETANAIMYHGTWGSASWLSGQLVSKGHLTQLVLTVPAVNGAKWRLFHLAYW